MTRLSGMTMNNAMIRALLKFDELHIGEISKIYPLEASSTDRGYDSVLFGIEYYENPYDFDSGKKCEMDVWIDEFEMKAQIRDGWRDGE